MNKVHTQLQGEIIAGFKLLRLLGSGGNGVVYLARQLSVDKIVACKILHPDLAENPVYIRNFVREARMAARLEHPNIIQALDVGSSDGFNYFAMEYVSGISLEQIRTGNTSRITQPFLLDVIIALADALDYAWCKFHIVHGDIKPDNLLIRDKDNTLKLADLGLAKVAGSDDPSGEIMATPLYAAPEIILGNTADCGVQCDIYSCGIMLYELLSGKAPFLGNMEEVLRQHVEKIPPPLHDANPSIDPELAAFVDRMISKTPVDRPHDWAEVKKKLSDIRKRIPADADHNPDPRSFFSGEEDPAGKWQKHLPAILKWSIAALVLIAVIIAIVMLVVIFL